MTNMYIYRAIAWRKFPFSVKSDQDLTETQCKQSDKKRSATAAVEIMLSSQREIVVVVVVVAVVVVVVVVAVPGPHS